MSPTRNISEIQKKKKVEMFNSIRTFDSIVIYPKKHNS